MRNVLRFGLVALGLSFFFSCNRGGREDAVHVDSSMAEPVPGDSVASSRLDPLSADLNTFYSDTIACSDCPGIVYRLFLETDSTCIRTEQKLGQGGFPLLQFGKVQRKDSLLTLFFPGGRIDRFRVSDTGMRMVNERGLPPGPSGDYTLEPDPAGFIDFSQPCVMDGVYFFLAEGAVFTPAGQATAYPVKPGKGSFDAEKIYLGRSRKDTGDLCLRAVVRIMKTLNLAGREITMAHIDKVIGRGVTCE